MKRKCLISVILLLALVSLCLVGCNGAEAKINRIEIAESPVTVYVQGQDLILNNASITVFYDNNSQKAVPITRAMISSFDPNLVGEQYLIVTYKGVETQLTIKVVPPDIIDIVMKSQPNKTEYILEQNLKLDGAVLQVNYVGGISQTFGITNSMVSGYNNMQVGEQIIFVAFNSYVTSFKVTVSDKVLTGMEIDTLPTKSIYFIRETLDIVGGKVFLQYNNGYPQIVDMDKLEGLEYEYNFDAPKDRAVVKVKYLDKSAVFEVAVKNKDATSFDIISAPTTPQLVNTDLNLEGYKIRVNYNNDTSEIFTLPATNVSVEGFDKTRIGKQTISLIFPGIIKKMFLEIIVVEKAPIGLEIITDGGVYFQDNRLDVVGLWKYKIVYNNGEKSSESYITEEMVVREFPNQDIFFCPDYGDKTLRFAMSDIVGEVRVYITPKIVSEIEVIQDGDLLIRAGAELNTDGVKLNVKYNDGSKIEIPLLPSMLSGFDSDYVGSQLLKLTYSDKFSEAFTIDYTVIVIKNAGALGIQSHPNKMEYVLGEKFELNGMAIALLYDGENKPTIISDFGYDFVIVMDGVDEENKFTSIGKKTLFVGYKGCDNIEEKGVTLEITVTNDLMFIEYLPESLGEVTEGNTLNLDGQYIVAHFQSESIKIPIVVGMTDYNKTDLTLGNRPITINFSANGTTQVCYTTIIVVKKEISSITIKNNPFRLDYLEVDIGGTIDLSGLELYINYNNGTRDMISYNETTALAIIASEYSTGVGLETIEISYTLNNKTFTTNISINKLPKVLSHIRYDVNSESDDYIPTITLKQGEILDIASETTENNVALGDLQLKLTYSDGKTEVVSIKDIVEDITIRNINTDSIGIQFVELYYKSVQFKLRLDIAAKNLLSITAIGNISVLEGTDINLDGILLSLAFDNDADAIRVPLVAESINKSANNLLGYDKTDNKIGEREVGIVYTYNGRQVTGTVNVTVVKKSLVMIVMDKLPKIRYIEGEAFSIYQDNLDSGTIKLIYDNGANEVKALEQATIGVSAALFNINIVKFNSNEFSGFSKLQTIFVNYRESSSSENFRAQYDIIMQDRKDAEIRYDNHNRYNFVYGEVVAARYNLYGYSAYGETVRENNLTDKTQVWYEDRTNIYAIIRYEDLPTKVGRYTVVVKYDSIINGDGVNNTFVDDSKEIIITPKTIYFQANDVARIYGENHNDSMYTFVALSSAKVANPSLENDKPYAYEENFASVFGSNNPIILTKDNNGNHIYAGSDIGRYVITISGLNADNYDIKYINGAYTVSPRKVTVTPNSTEVVYGKTNINLTYNTSVVAGDAASGMYGEDKLIGNLSYVGNYDVGSYAINKGTLSNRNYEILMSEVTQYLIIKPKNIYIKFAGYNKIYGEVSKDLTVNYFSDENCTDTNAFVFPEDNAAQLGELSYKMGMETITEIGQYLNNGDYTVLPVITKLDTSTDNYNVIAVASLVVINKRPISITANNNTKVFGDTDPTLMFSANPIQDITESGLVDSQTILGSLTRDVGEEYGNYAIRIGNLESSNPNYAIRFSGALFSITKRSLSLRLENQALTKIYDGKYPKISTADISLYNKEELYDAFDKNEIKIGFNNANRNVGSYLVNLTYNNPNYIITLEENYFYEITPKEISANFVGLPTLGQQYDAKTHSFRADAVGLCSQYYEDGTLITDNTGNPILDNVTVRLDNSTYLNAGSYLSKTLGLEGADKGNYTLLEKEATFRIEPRKLIFSLKNTIQDTFIMAKAYTGQEALISGADYLITGGISGVSIPVTVKVLHNDPTASSAPREVLIIDDQISEYDISVTITDKNFVIEKEADYKFRITPRDIKVTIYPDRLRKTFNASAPYLDESMYVFSEFVLMTGQDIAFNFQYLTESGAEGNPIAIGDVGKYKVKMVNRNKNYTVQMAGEYVFEIQKQKVDISIKSSSLAKTFDATIAKLSIEDVTFTPYYGTAPTVATKLEEREYTENIVFQILNDGKLLHSDVGMYPITLTVNDRNREYNLKNNNPTFVINKKNIKLRVSDVVEKYGQTHIINGTEVDDAPINNYSYVVGFEPISGFEPKIVLERYYPNANHSHIGNHQAGVYPITFNADGISNYNITYEVKGTYIIEKAKLFVKIADDIGINSAYGKVLVYGDTVEETMLKRWEYINNPSEANSILKSSNIGAAIDNVSCISAADAQFLCNYNGTPIIGQKRVRAGSYPVIINEAKKFTSTNYEVEAFAGTLTIAKKTIKVMTNNQSLTAEYGDVFVDITYEGIVEGDSVKQEHGYTLIDGISNKDPIALVDGRPLNSTTPAGQSMDATLYLDTDFDHINYELDIHSAQFVITIKRAKIVIQPRPIKLSLGGDKVELEKLEMVYGSVPKLNVNYDFVYTLKNGETFESLGVEYPTFEAQKQVANKQPISGSEFKWATDSISKLKNYEITVNDFPFFTTTKTLNVNVFVNDENDKHLSVVYSDPADKLTCFDPLLDYAGNSSLVWHYKIEVEGLAFSEKLQDVFSISGNVPAHSITSLASAKVGKNKKIVVNGFMFLGNPNYEIEYGTSDLELSVDIYTKVDTITRNDTHNMVYKNGNVDLKDATMTFFTTSLVNIVFIAMDGSNVPDYLLGNSSKFSDVFTFTKSIDSTKLNQNQTISVKYKATYPTKIKGVMGSVTCEVNSSFDVRIFGTEDKDVSTSLKDDSNNALVLRDKIDATNSTKNFYHKDASNKIMLTDFDSISTSIRLRPTAKTYGYELILQRNGDNFLSIIFDNENANSAVLYYRCQDVNGKTANVYQSLDIGRINLFDGYVHDITVSINKLTNILSLVIDGNSVVKVLLKTDITESTEGAKPVSYYFISNETSQLGFSIYGVEANVSAFSATERGYYDKFDTQALPEEGKLGYNVKQNNLLVFLSGTSAILEAKMSDFFRSISATEYTEHYFLNGLEVRKSEVITLRFGRNTLEYIIKDGSIVVSKSTLNVFGTTARYYQMNNSEVKETSPANIYGAEYAVNNGVTDTSVKTNTDVKTKDEYATMVNNTEGNVIRTTVAVTKPSNAANKSRNVFILKANQNGTKNNPFDGAAVNYNGIAVVAEYNGSKYTTSLYVSIGKDQYWNTFREMNSTSPVNIDWSTGKYMLEMVMDTRTRYIQINIYNVTNPNATLVSTVGIKAGSTFENSTVVLNKFISENNFRNLMSGGNDVAFSIQDSAVRVTSITANESSPTVQDYIINDEYKLFDKDGVTLASNSTMTVATRYATNLIEEYKNIELDFEITETGTNNKLVLEIFNNELDATKKRRAYLTYYMATNTMEFNFEVIDNGNVWISKTQTIDLGTKILTTGRHKIRVVMSTADMPIINRNYVASDERANILSLDYMDGYLTTKIANLYVPNYYSVANWYNIGGNVSQGTTPTTTPYFIGKINKTQLSVIGDSQIKVYSYMVH